MIKLKFLEFALACNLVENQVKRAKKMALDLSILNVIINSNEYKVPHIGWNKIIENNQSIIFEGIKKLLFCS